MQIAIAVITLVLCAGVLYWFRRSENKKRNRRTEEEEDERERLAQKTAQEFVNAKDLGSIAFTRLTVTYSLISRSRDFALSCTADRSRSACVENFLLLFRQSSVPTKVTR